MNKWIAFYVKYISETDPFNIEIHGWICEGNSSEEALKALEENPSVPYRMFLAEVVPVDQKELWIAEGQQEAQQLGVASPRFVMHYQI
ncbi:MAG: hypothetical protein F6K28_13140 [Microcoleus sp. SIO2G3]|nr:hypothetical protein [Microcoleus sp. SIO2G3]